MKHKHILTLLAVMMSVLLFLVACGEKAGTSAGENLETAEKTDEIETSPPPDFDGAEFAIITREFKKYDIGVEEQNGEIVNDAIYFRNLAVEDRLNIKMNIFTTAGEWENMDNYKKTVKNSILGGTGAYDLITGYQVFMVSTIYEGLYKDLNQIKYLELSNPWWTQKINGEMTVNNRIYLATGDASVVLWENIYALMFNKNMVQIHEIPDLYQLVKTGEWTLPKLMEITKDITQDVDGNGKYDKNDLYGFGTMIGNFTDNYYVSLDIPVTKWDENGYPYLAENSPKMYQAIDLLHSYFHKNNSVFTIEDPWLSNVMEPMFFDDRLMIMPTMLGDIKNMRNMNTDFGILPYPKWDKEQKEYLTSSHGSFNIFGVPEDAKNPDMSGAVLEALCAESSKKVVPAFYETVLKGKFARDEESAEMLDIIRNGLSATFGYLYMVPLASGTPGGIGPGLIFRITINKSSVDYLSYYEKYENLFNSNLEQIIEAYKNLE